MLLQSIFILLSSLAFLMINSQLDFFSSLYGGMISLINNYLIIRISNKQKNIKPNNMQIGFALVWYSVISRLIVVGILILVGLKLNLLAFALIIGFIVGQISLIVEKLRNTSGR